MSDVTVRRASGDDLDLVAALFDGYRQFYRQPSDPARVRAFLADRLRNGDSIVLLAFLEGQAVGFVQLYPTFSSVSIGRALVLNDLFTSASARGRGVGRALIESAVQFGRESGALYLELATEITNSSAQRLYEAMGWARETDFYRYSLNLR
ncbi:MAG: N-acetyltransferase family protein [Gemmatimonadales bacterium]